MEVGEGFEGAAGPVTAGDLRDGEKGTPVVSQAVVGPRGHGRIAGLEGGEVVLGPTGQFAAEDGFDLLVAAIEMDGELLGFGAEEQDANGAVVQGFGQVADAGEHGGPKGFEGADGIALAFAAVGAGAFFVPGVKDRATLRSKASRLKGLPPLPVASPPGEEREDVLEMPKAEG